MTWQKIGDVAANRGMMPRAGSEPTEDEREVMNMVLGLCEAIEQGCPMETALDATTFRERFCAIHFCPLTDLRRETLKRLIDAAIERSGALVTAPGVFGHEELSQASARKTTIERNGEMVSVVQFAVGYDSAGRPIYPARDRKLNTYSFRQGPPPSSDEAGEEVIPWFKRLEQSEK